MAIAQRLRSRLQGWIGAIRTMHPDAPMFGASEAGSTFREANAAGEQAKRAASRAAFPPPVLSENHVRTYW